MEGQLISLLSFAALASACGAVLLGLRDLFTPRPSASDVPSVRRLPRGIEQEENAGTIRRFDSWFERTLYMSGWPLSPVAAVLLHLMSSLLFAGPVYIVTDNLLLTAIAGLFGFAIVLISMVIAQRRRVKKFLEQFPGALDLLARAVRAGESLEQAIELVGESARDPLSTEFRRCSGQLDMGLSVSATMQGLTRRMDLVDVRIFANTLSMHRDVGGNLAATLERLAEVIRDRRSFQRQLKSVTGAGRFTALFIATLGPLLFAYLFIFQPQYGEGLLNDKVGQVMLGYAVVSQLVGLFWVSRLLKNDL